MLKLQDLRKTTRRTGDGDLRIVYPKFLRERTLAPRIDMAVRYLEAALGRTRRELDEEVIIQLFGDHKLARCIIGCLSASYRHRARTFAEVLPPEQCTALVAAGITTPSELRLWLFRAVNRLHAGFASTAERPAILREAGEALGLSARQVEQLISLDQPANAVLARMGPRPSAAEVIARFNYETTAALLANAALVRISLARVPGDPAAMRALCERAGVAAELAGRELVLQGRQDALGGWARHGARLVRLLADLLACGLPTRAGEALVAAPSGGEWRFRLDGAVLADLGALSSAAMLTFDAPALVDAYAQLPRLMTDLAALRRAGGAEGWTLRRATEPLILAGAVVPALAVCVRGRQRVPLIAAPATDEHARHLAQLLAERPVVVFQPGPAPREAADRAAVLPALAYTVRGDVAALPDLLAHALGEAARHEGLARVEAVMAEALTAGVLAEPQLAERLGCAEEDVWARLALPAARAAGQASGLHYVEGFGLCTAEVLARAQAAASEVTVGEPGTATEPVRAVRLLGRRLREVTGASEGIECLIAYLGAA